MKARTVAEYTIMRRRAAEGEQRMKLLREKVLAHLEMVFQLKGFDVTEFPLLPGGVVLKDRNGHSSAFYWDILTGQVKSTG